MLIYLIPNLLLFLIVCSLKWLRYLRTRIIFGQITITLQNMLGRSSIVSVFYLLSILIISSISLSQIGCSNYEKTKIYMEANQTTKKSCEIVDYNILGKNNDDHLYLEEILGEKALGNVKDWNNRTLKRLLADPIYYKMNKEALKILNNKYKIPYVSILNGEVYNYWVDDKNVRGIWRKASVSSYLSVNPSWEILLDLDELSQSEGNNWVFKGVGGLSPNYDLWIVSLSDGGKDAVIHREFNTKTKSFVNGGFATKESKGYMNWVDRDTVIIGVDFGKGSMTNSGYPMISKVWKRGTSLSRATEIGRGDQADVSYSVSALEFTNGQKEIIIKRAITFYDSEYFWLPQKSSGSYGEKIKLPIPEKSLLNGEFKGQSILELSESWRGFKSGDLVSFSFEEFMKYGKIYTVNLLYRADGKSSINDYVVTKSKVLISVSHNVKGAVYEHDWVENNWISRKLDFPDNGSISIISANDKENIAFISTESFLEPDTLYTYNTSISKKAKVKSQPILFDTKKMATEQFFVRSKDGTMIPYFVVRNTNIKMNGKSPTLLYGYGGFQISLNPNYSAIRGKLWLERGGVYVLANIRGGGEYGPEWHKAGLKTKRQRIYDDFIAVAEDLIAKKITSPEHLGIVGGSNGGLLMGVMLTQRPDLFNAVVCISPLLDMLRYHTLLSGASWLEEYGSPDSCGEGNFLRKISPYHNIIPSASYPEVLFLTSTKDDRVHPGHARKMAKRMEDQGHKFLYYENIDGGHSAAANVKESAKRDALMFSYLLQKLSAN